VRPPLSSRVLPAHVVVAAAVVGLALSDVARVGVRGAVLVFGVLTAAALLAAPPPRRRLLCAALVVGVAGWWWGSTRLDRLDASVLRSDVGIAGRALVAVTGESRVGAFDQRLPAQARRFDGRRVGERVELELPLGRAPPQGALVSLLAVVRLPRGPHDGFDERTWLRHQGVHVVLKVDEWHQVGRRHGLAGGADRLRAWLRRASTPGLAGERRALVEGVVLGDDAGLSDGLKTSFRRSGLYHLLAVSGQNVVLLAGGVLGLALLLGVPRAWGHVSALVAIGGYVLAVGPQPSVIRAAVSGIAVSVAWLSSRERDPWHVLLLAALVLLGWSPYAIYDPGFQLSFAAVIGIFLAAGPLARVLEGYPMPAPARTALAISAVCSLVTAPILWLQFGKVPLLGVVANLLVEPAIGPLLGLALVTAAVQPVAPPLAAALAWLNGGIAAYTAACARLVSAAPFAQASGATAGIAAACALTAAAYAWRRWRTTSSRPI
jgi:competence protein ComEC